MEEKEQSKLDDEFKKILTKIRPYIIKLSNPQYITSCRVWMEKLSVCKSEESSIRNDYLNELYRQMQNGKIEEPFLKLPPDGPLVENTLPGSSTSWSDISSTSTIATIEVPASGDSFIDETQVKEPTFSDLYEKKIEEQQMMIQNLQEKNDLLSQKLSSKRNLRNSKAEISINMMASEVEYLKERLRELMTMKKNLQASHNAIILQWEDATRNLEYELRIERQKNNELQQRIEELELSYANNETEQTQDANDEAEKKLLDKHQEEIRNIQEKHKEEIKEIKENNNDLLKQKDQEHELVIQELKNNYEKQLEELKTESEKTLKFRDDEINRLEKLLDVQCERTHMDAEHPSNDALMDKINFLQDCILKMEKLLRRYEKHYSKKISVLTNELVMKENSIQMQLTTQRAQLLAKASSDRQSEIEEIVAQLERRYRQLLEDQQCQITEIRQDYLNIIKQLMDKFDIKSSIA